MNKRTYSISYLEASLLYLSASTLAIKIGLLSAANTGAAASN
jgi:hypothetical protein